MQYRRPQNASVFFSGIPLHIEKAELRKHFDSIGHTTDFRLFGPTAGKNFRYGIADYMDDQTAEVAISRLNGTRFGDREMRVSLANSNSRNGGKKRRRDGLPFGSPNGAAAYPTTDKYGRELMAFPRTFSDPLLGREDSLIIDALRGIATEDAYEAVEQLRVLALERSQDARALLESNPALCCAVVMILQHAGRLPQGQLPPEAYESRHQAATEDDASSRTGTGAASEAQQREEVLQLIQNMSEEDVERVLSMTDEELMMVPDAAQRGQLEVLRNRLLQMSSEL